MNAEEYFVKEFKKYTDYKSDILSGKGYEHDPRIGILLSSASSDFREFVDGYMKSQIRYLRGADLGCTGNVQGKSIFTEFLEKSLPAHIFSPLDISSKIDQCVILNIPESELYFSKLNESVVHLQPRAVFTKRVTGNDGKFIKDSDGNDFAREVPVSAISRVVSSHINIRLPNMVEGKNGRMERYYPSEGFAYLDFEGDGKPKADGKIYRRYSIPREYIYPLNLNVLLLTASRLSSRYYWGRQYYFNRGVGMAYLYIAPYCTALKKPQNVMFCMKDSLDYEKEIEYLESYWRSRHILYPVEDTEVQSAMSNLQSSENNLSFRTLPEPDREEYKRYDKSLAEIGEVDNGTT